MQKKKLFLSASGREQNTAALTALKKKLQTKKLSTIMMYESSALSVCCVYQYQFVSENDNTYRAVRERERISCECTEHDCVCVCVFEKILMTLSRDECLYVYVCMRTTSAMTVSEKKNCSSPPGVFHIENTLFLSLVYRTVFSLSSAAKRDTFNY